MNELNEEIKLTLNLMQGDIDGGAHNELQWHLYSLLEIKRNELQQRLVERSWSEPVTHDHAPHKSVKLDGKIADESKPLTAEELKAGGWWCADTSEECRLVFAEKGILARSADWLARDGVKYCYMSGSIIVRSFMEPYESTLTPKQIHRIGNEFYWSEK